MLFRQVFKPSLTLETEDFKIMDKVQHIIRRIRSLWGYVISAVRGNDADINKIAPTREENDEIEEELVICFK